MSLDVYVKPYVPAWLHRINDASDVTHIPLPDDHGLDEARYIASFSGTDVWQSDSPISSVTSPSLLQQRIEELQESLALEDVALQEQARSWAQYEISLRQYNPKQLVIPGSGKTAIYVCTIKGIAEFTPRVLIDDAVELRQLIPHEQTFDGFVLHARVVGVKRTIGQVLLEAPAIRMHSGVFNISFQHDKRSYTTTSAILKQIAAENSSWMLSNCFPDYKHCKLKTQLTQVRNFQWKDEQLNFEQMRAIQEIYEQRYGDLPYLIQGPPGTGKTKTVVEAILQIYELIPESRILACGASNTAADTLAMRLIKHIRNPKTLLRLNSNSRSFEECPEPLLPYSHIEHDRFMIPEFKELMAKRIIVATTAEMLQLNRIRCDNQSLSRLEKFLSSSLFPERVQRESHVHFTHLFMDEAAQATEPEAICVLKLVEPGPGQKVTVVFAGDHKQLGPRILSQQARARSFEHSLFERLIGQACYASHPLSRKNVLENPRPQLPFLYPAFANLYRNYRSHSAILTVPSQLFYNSSLMASATDVETIAHGLNRPSPIIFVGHEGLDNAADIQAVTSWYNQTEIGIVVNRVQALLNDESAHIKPEEIAIMAPYREQVVRIRLALRKLGLRAVSVGSVEDYQGAEARVVIVSIVRSARRFLETDHETASGLIYEPRRMNVALTRARELLLVVGNVSIMLLDDSWKAWLHFVKAYGEYVEPGETKCDAKASAPSDRRYHAENGARKPLGVGVHSVIDRYSDEAMIAAGDSVESYASFTAREDAY